MKRFLNLKNQSRRAISLSLSALFLASTLGVCAVGNGTADKAAAADKADRSVTVSSKDTDDKALSVSKDETVYVIASADGTAQKIIVSDWLKNAGTKGEVTDKSNLQNIENVNGDEGYTMNGKDMKVWTTDGADICYQGTSSEPLPVTLGVEYYLDGKKVSADEIRGKSGDVKLRFNYTNTLYENVEIGGRNEKIYVPFLMLTGLILDNDHFSEVEVTNGKLINDGNHTVVMGLALPGLREDLNLDSDKLDIPDYVEISAKADKFTLATTMTLASNELFNSVNFDDVSDLDDLKDSMSELTDAMTKLMDGSSALYNGLDTLLNKSDDLISGVKQLNNGAKALSDGAKKLSTGAGTLNSKKSDLTGGAKDLQNGLSELTKNNSALTGGAEQVYNTLLSQVSSQLKENGITTEKLTIKNYNKVLNALLKNPTAEQQAQLIAIASKEMDSKLAAVPEDYRPAAKVLIYDKVTAGKDTDTAMKETSEMLTTAGTVSAVMANDSIAPDPTVYAGMLAQGYSKQDAGIVAKLCTALAQQKGGSAVSYINSAAEMAKTAAAVQAAAADKKATEKSNKLCLMLAINTLTPTIQNAQKQLDTYGTFYQGVVDYTNGATAAYEGSKKLSKGANTVADAIGEISSGAKSLSGGADELYAGTSKLNSSTGALKDGVKKLTNGAMQLSSGLKQFNSEGVGRLVSLSGDVDSLLERLRAIQKVSKNYRTYSGIADNMDGSVKFIYKTDSVEPDDKAE